MRSELARRSGRKPSFGWYFRTDPQIAEIYGRADHILAKYPERPAAFIEMGDYLGVHSHPIRWCSERQSWIHDFLDGKWNEQCTRFALDAFASWNKAPARRFRSGAGFLTEEIVSALELHGVQVDMSLEPVDAWPASFSEVPTGIDSSPYLGIHISCLDAPRTAYRPSQENFRIPANLGARNLTILPLTTHDFAPWRPRWRGWLDAITLRTKPKDVRVLHLSEQWPNGKFYWDLVAKRLSTMRVPYLSLAVRTDAPGSLPITRARELLSGLLQHPLIERLDFCDPVEMAPTLV